MFAALACSTGRRDDVEVSNVAAGLARPGVTARPGPMTPTTQGLEPVSQEEAMPVLAEAFGKPTFGENLNHAKYGLLCSVAKTGQEQGQTAARMLLKAMKGTPVTDIPVTRNHNGRQIVNVEVMKSLGIKPSSTFLQQVELVKTEK